MTAKMFAKYAYSFGASGPASIIWNYQDDSSINTDIDSDHSDNATYFSTASLRAKQNRPVNACIPHRSLDFILNLLKVSGRHCTMRFIVKKYKNWRVMIVGSGTTSFLNATNPARISFATKLCSLEFFPKVHQYPRQEKSATWMLWNPHCFIKFSLFSQWHSNESFVFSRLRA